jgi:flagellar hook-basal body complex protein FliE
MSIDPISATSAVGSLGNAGSLGGINGIGGIGSIDGVGGTDALDSSAGSGAASATGGTDFANQLDASLQHLQNLDTTSDNLAVQAATGQLTDVHDYIIAATQANLTTQLAVQVRNKALDAFNEIMRMQA